LCQTFGVDRTVWEINLRSYYELMNMYCLILFYCSYFLVIYFFINECVRFIIIIIISSMPLVEYCCLHKVPPVSTILCSPPRGVQTNVGKFQIIFNSSTVRVHICLGRSLGRTSEFNAYLFWIYTIPWYYCWNLLICGKIFQHIVKKLAITTKLLQPSTGYLVVQS